jgi:hypothetical protein
MRPSAAWLWTALGAAACTADDAADGAADAAVAPLLAQYATVSLTADPSSLSDAERRMVPLLIEAARHMDPPFWDQAYGDPDSLLSDLDDGYRRYAMYNYGPWDRLAGDSAFVPGVGPKPPGANLYPADMTREEFEAFVAAHPDQADAMQSLYTLIRRGEDGALRAVPYHVAYLAHLDAAAGKLREAAALAEDPALARYLMLRAEALVTDEYQPSDLAWLDMKDNTLDVVIGAIETYEDQLFGYKAAYEAYVLVKDRAWSERLSRYAALLPGLQRGLPVPDAYKREMPGTSSDLNAYDAVYYAGQANAGSKTIAINLPNDPDVQRAKGTRRLQLKNAMRAKFDRILVPIAGLLIADDQRHHVTFDAFFANTMFHEVAHGLGITTTLAGNRTVREALREHASALEEGKADILGLWMITSLFEQGEIPEGDVRDNYVTFLASVFRSVRFGASSAHGKANMVRFNFFAERGAFTRDDATGAYRVDFDAMRDATRELSELILRLQGDGDYDGAARLLAERGVIGTPLRFDLDRLADARIPVDIVFAQGTD